MTRVRGPTSAWAPRTPPSANPETAKDHWTEALEIYAALGLLAAGEVRARLTALDAVR